MKLFLIPLTKQRLLIYAQQLGKATPRTPSLLDRLTRLVLQWTLALCLSSHVDRIKPANNQFLSKAAKTWQEWVWASLMVEFTGINTYNDA